MLVKVFNEASCWSHSTLARRTYVFFHLLMVFEKGKEHVLTIHRFFYKLVVFPMKKPFEELVGARIGNLRN